MTDMAYPYSSTLVAHLYIYYSKTCLKGSLKKDKTKILMTNGSLMNEGQKYCRMLPLEHSAILLTCIKR